VRVLRAGTAGLGSIRPSSPAPAVALVPKVTDREDLVVGCNFSGQKRDAEMLHSVPVAHNEAKALPQVAEETVGTPVVNSSMTKVPM
jgi:hypothetical protein